MHSYPEHVIPHEPSKGLTSERQRKLISGRSGVIQVSNHEWIQDQSSSLNPGPKALLTMLNQVKSRNL